MLRKGLLALSRSRQVEAFVMRLPAASSVAARFVPGAEIADVVEATRALVADGRTVTVALLGSEAGDEDRAEENVAAYLELLEVLHLEGLSRSAEVTVTLSALGQSVPDIGAKVGAENVRRIARAARFAGTALTLDTENHGTTDAVLETLHELRKEYPETGVTLQACLRRTEADCRALAYEGSRVRLCAGSQSEPETRAYGDRHEIDKSYVRCLKVLMAGQGYPMVATHDPRLIRIAGALATRYGRVQGSYEFQLRHGVRTEEQQRLVGVGEQVRVYVPYGAEWYRYLTSLVPSLLFQK